MNEQQQRAPDPPRFSRVAALSRASLRLVSRKRHKREEQDEQDEQEERSANGFSPPVPARIPERQARAKPAKDTLRTQLRKESHIPPISHLLDFEALCRVSGCRVPIGMVDVELLAINCPQHQMQRFQISVSNDLLPLHKYRSKFLLTPFTRRVPAVGDTVVHWKTKCNFTVPVSWSDRRVLLEAHARPLVGRERVVGLAEIDLRPAVAEAMEGENEHHEVVDQWVPLLGARGLFMGSLRVRAVFHHGRDKCKERISHPEEICDESDESEGEVAEALREEERRQSFHASHVGERMGSGSGGEGEGEGEGEGGDEGEGEEDEGVSELFCHELDLDEITHGERKSRQLENTFLVGEAGMMFDIDPPPPFPLHPAPLGVLHEMREDLQLPAFRRDAAAKVLERWDNLKTGDIILYSTAADISKGIVEFAANKVTKMVTSSPYTHIGMVVVCTDEQGERHVTTIEATINGDQMFDYLQRSPHRQCVYMFSLVDRLHGSSSLDLLPLAEPLSEDQDLLLQRFACKEWRRDPQYDDTDFVRSGIHEMMKRSVGESWASVGEEDWSQFMCSELTGALVKVAFGLKDLNTSVLAPSSFLDHESFPMYKQDALVSLLVVPED